MSIENDERWNGMYTDIAALDGNDTAVRALKVRDDHVHLRELGDDLLVLPDVSWVKSSYGAAYPASGCDRGASPGCSRSMLLGLVAGSSPATPASGGPAPCNSVSP